jgi:hypothetical protein
MQLLDLHHSNSLNLKRLNISRGLTAFPLEILEVADSLEVLDLSNNNLTSLPDEFAQFTNLKVVFFNNNLFEVVPEVLATFPNLKMVSFKSNRLREVGAGSLPSSLQWLTLTNNQIKTLPTSMGQLRHLRKFLVAGNQLQSLPDEMAACQDLELIRLAANRLTHLPNWLFSLPRLSWLAYAGNPFCSTWASTTGSSSLPDLEWQQFTLGKVLGQGASGVIYQGTRQVHRAVRSAPSSQATPPQPLPQPVAVKIFKGEVTSDGYPDDEMRACLAAGGHPHLVPLIGKLVNHPRQQQGLVFDLIPPDYSNLGNPPSLESCTRDTYPATTTFSLSVLIRIAQGIAAAACHLHGRGILHGDLYPHNTLITESGDSLLGDFGAASFYNPGDRPFAEQLERIEVRAFGCLLEDMLHRVQVSVPDENGDRPDSAQVLAQLWHLHQDCVQITPSQRPLFATIGDRLTEIEQVWRRTQQIPETTANLR